MIPVTQSKVGGNGTCFRSCLASILELQEHEVPDINDFTESGFMGAVNDFLYEHGLYYRRVPIDGVKPSGYSTIEGVSPRGGLHACVAYDGRLVHDPHPQDGTGRGLVEPRYYGLLEQRGRAIDRADMLQLRRNTEKQGGPFLVQVTEKDGREHTVPTRALVKDAVMNVNKYSMRELLDALGIDIKAYMRRTEPQKTELLRTAIEKLNTRSRAKDGALTSWAAILLAIYALYKSRTEEETPNYNLAEYRPPKKIL